MILNCEINYRDETNEHYIDTILFKAPPGNVQVLKIRRGIGYKFGLRRELGTAANDRKRPEYSLGQIKIRSIHLSVR